MWPGEDARRSTSEAGLSCCLELLAQGALRLRNLERQMQATSRPTLGQTLCGSDYATSVNS